MPRPRRAIAALALLAAVVACSDAYTEPPNAAGRYALVSYDGAAVPVPYGVLVTVPVGGGTAIICDRALAGDTIDLGTMRFARRLTFTTTCGGAAIPSSTISTSTGRYTLASSAITFLYEIPAESPLGSTFTTDAIRHGDTLLVTRTTVIDASGIEVSSSTPIRYARVR